MFDRVLGKLINCKEYSITQFKRFTLRGENLFLLFVLSISTLSFSQEKIDTILSVSYDFDIKVSIEQIKIDTLTISGGWHMTGENGNYYRYPECGEIIKIETDSVLPWQTDIELIRTKTFGRTDYKDTGRIPFQFVADTITRILGVTTYRWQTFATEKHCIKTFVDGIYTGLADDSCTPGTVNYHGTELRRHSNSLDNLQPNTAYNILIEGTTDNGDFNIIKFKIITLPIEAPAQMSGVKIE